jgi:hypothetical protein
MLWFTVDCDLPDHPKMAALPTDAARWGWIVVLARAKRQRQQGTFANAGHFKAVMGKYATYLPAYIEARLMDELPDTTLAVHDWDRHQWKVKKAGQRGDNEGTFEGQEVDPRVGARAVAVSVPVVLSTVEGVVKGDDHLPVLAWLRDHGVQRIVGKVLNDLIEFTENDGADALIGAMEQLGPNLDAAQYVYGARNRLHPIPSSSRQQKPNSPHLADLQAATEVV